MQSSLKSILESGGSINDIREGFQSNAKYSIDDLISFGYTLKDLIPLGFGTADFHRVGIDKKILIRIGYSLADLKQGGYKIHIRDGFTLREVYDAGYNMKEIEDMGYGVHNEEDFSSPDKLISLVIKSYGKNFSALYQIAVRMKKYGFTISDMKRAGSRCAPPLVWDCGIELKRAGYSVQEILDNGYTLRNLIRNDSLWHNEALYNEILALGVKIPVSLLKETGYSLQKIREMHYDYSDIRLGGFTVIEFLEYYGVYDVKECEQENIIHLLSIGFETQELIDAGVKV